MSRLADDTAPLDVLLVDAALGPVRRFVPGRVDRKVGCRPSSVRRGPPPGGSGSWAPRPAGSSPAPRPWRRTGDRRFTDVAWTENPPLKRLVQLYLAASRTAEQLTIDADLDPRDRKRVQFFLENVVEAVAPSNVPAGQPGLGQGRHRHRRAEPGARGQAAVHDLATPPRVPEMVDSSGFTLGENIAATPGAVVFRNEVLELIQYAPQTDEVYEVPALVVPPTINKFYALDLTPERSLVEFGVRQGRQIFVISWRNPDSRHASWNFDTYVRAVLDALDAVEEITGSARTVLGGVCSGGILASIAAAYLAGIGRQDRLAGLCLAVTVIDSHDAGTVSRSSTIGWPAGPRQSPRARGTSTAGS